MSTKQTPPTDTLFAEPLADPGLFTFNDAVASVFPDMINRSVPGYSTVVAMTGVLASQHARPGSRIYDLGCSWGASLLSAAREPACGSCELIGIDNSAAMLTQAKLHLASLPEGKRISFKQANIIDANLDNASVVILNYTLQFIPVAQRAALLNRIRQAMSPGDVLILSEKLTLPDKRLNDYLIDLHHDFKRQQGYSDLQIAQKRQALEDVLVPETRQAHIDRLDTVGFSRSDTWFQCLNFASMIAIA
ncbi:MAG: carboxy-S-adenosyl-L-methionine synthase CmoA [Luminiphilus sp.]|jgi:tRNA (cmo5U34)-methyltransferase|nr:carboxy-S-adenosyl-L-methionine synthase CmoA [Luminiphilus sp.]